MVVRIKSFYLKPDFRTREIYLESVVQPQLLKQIVPNQTNCLVADYSPDPNKLKVTTVAQAFYYSSYFHPNFQTNYKIKVVKDVSNCGNSNIIPRNIEETKINKS